MRRFSDLPLLALWATVLCDGLSMTGAAFATDMPVNLARKAEVSAAGPAVKFFEPGWAVDREAAARSLGQLRAFAEAYPRVKVVLGHER